MIAKRHTIPNARESCRAEWGLEFRGLIFWKLPPVRSAGLLSCSRHRPVEGGSGGQSHRAICHHHVLQQPLCLV